MTVMALFIYTIILIKSVAVRKLDVAILARSSREMSQTVRVSFRPSNFYTRKTPRIALKPCRLRECLFQWTTDRPREGAVTASRLVAIDTPNSDNLNSDNCGHSGHSGDSLSQNGEKPTIQNGDNHSLCLHGLKNVV